MLDKTLHPYVVDRVVERPDVGVEHPANPPVDPHGERIQCVVRTPAGPESVREPQKLRLVDRLQNPPHRLLDALVFQRRDTERALASIAFRDVHAPDRLRVIAPTVDAVLQVVQALVETVAVPGPGHRIHAGRRVATKALVRLREPRHPEVDEQVGPFLLRSLFRALPDPLQGRGHVAPALGRGRVSCNRLSLGRGPSLHRLDGRYPRLRRLLRYYARV